MLATFAPDLLSVDDTMRPKLDKRRIARHFRKGRCSYDQQALAQHNSSKKLLNIVKSLPQERCSNILEIGCGTGALTEQLLDAFAVDKLYLNDLVCEFYSDVKTRLQPHNRCCEIIPWFGDIEDLTLPTDLDLVISASTFQWLENLGRLLRTIASALQPSGRLAFSTFAAGTLAEFHELTGIGLTYEKTATICALLEPNFHLETVETTQECLFFNSPRSVLRHLQATGVGGVASRPWTPQRLRQFEHEYRRRFAGSNGVPLTYVSTCFVALKKSR